MRRRLLAAASVAALSVGFVGPVGSVSAQDPSTRVDTLAATVSGATVNITGTATFVDVPAIVGTDPEGDAATPLPGTDITWATIARAYGSDSLTFTLGLKDMSPTGGGAPGYVYRWPLYVDGFTTGLSLEAAGSPTGACWASDVPPVDPIFRIARGFETIAWLEGSFADNAVTFKDVPLSVLGASAGSRIQTSGVGPFTGVAIDIPNAICVFSFAPSVNGDSIALDDYVVPGATVQLGMAPEGTPVSDVPLTVAATLGEDGTSFSGSLPAPAVADDYVVVAKACYVPDLCDVKSITLTI